jgi:hypothetical protein
MHRASLSGGTAVTMRRLAYVVGAWILIQLIFWADYALKVAIGLLVVYLVWLPTGWPFGRGCLIAGWLLGLCLVGFYEGCDIILNGYAKSLADCIDPPKPPPKDTP